VDQEKRSTFCNERDIYEKQGRSIVYIDESGFAHDMPRTHGYSRKGNKCYGSHDWGAKGRTNVIGALIGSALLTAWLVTGSVDTEVFTYWIQQDLLPQLQPNTVIVMDNATFHKGKDMQKMIEDAGHTLLYLPPYSPDLNPIEKKWAQIKKARRSSQVSIEGILKFFLS
jgi:transposase